MDFKTAYDKELSQVDEGSFEWEMLNLRQTRAFMYEVFKLATIDPKDCLKSYGEGPRIGGLVERPHPTK